MARLGSLCACGGNVQFPREQRVLRKFANKLSVKVASLFRLSFTEESQGQQELSERAQIMGLLRRLANFFHPALAVAVDSTHPESACSRACSR